MDTNHFPNQMERPLKHSKCSVPNYESFDLCILGCVYLFLHLSMFMITSTVHEFTLMNLFLYKGLVKERTDDIFETQSYSGKKKIPNFERADFQLLLLST